MSTSPEHHSFDDLTRLDSHAAGPREPRGWRHRLLVFLRSESAGGYLLMLFAAVAIVWANTPAAAAYFGLRDLHLTVPLGFTTLDLSLGHWAADGLLAVFFFVVGLELKEEIVLGELRDWRRALTPVTAAIGGVAVPAVIFSLLALGTGAGPGAIRGWAVPTATDIAFAVAVLGVVGRFLPSPLRLFLLTLAVVDDLIAIVIIAVFYADGVSWAWLLAATAPALVFGILVQCFPDFFRRGWASWAVLLPLGVATWVCMLSSGVHATIAGVVLGFLVPARRRRGGSARGVASAGGGTPAGAGASLAQHLDHRVGPLSAGLCVPLFAFFSAGVSVGGGSGLRAALGDAVFWGIVAGLVLGKPLGILAATWLVTRTPVAALDPRVRWGELLGVGMLGGIGFTVALLVAELSFGEGSPHDEHAKLAILFASVLAAALSAAWLAPRNRRYRREAERSGS